MFKSKEWKSSKLAKSKDRIIVEKFVRDKLFCTRGVFPLIRVLCMVESDEKPAMRLIYEGIERGKEKTRSSFNGVARR